MTPIDKNSDKCIYEHRYENNRWTYQQTELNNTLKGLYTMSKWDLSLECKDS